MKLLLEYPNSFYIIIGTLLSMHSGMDCTPNEWKHNASVS